VFRPSKWSIGICATALGSARRRFTAIRRLSLLILLQSAPEGYAAANWTEVKLESLAPDISQRFTRDLDAFIFVVVRPEHAVAPACRAVAGGRTVRLPFKLPSHRATETGSLNHFSAAPPRLVARFRTSCRLRSPLRGTEAFRWFMSRRQMVCAA
jgi:hypothetical protein